MKKSRKRYTITGLIGLFITCLMITAGSSKAQDGAKSADSVKTILFVGNSLTYANDLPSMVVKLANKKGITIKTETLAFPNYALEDHWNDGKIQKLIAEKRFDFVVVQQGPSSQNDGRVMLLENGARIKALCDMQNTKLAFFMVWPAYDNLHMFEGVIKNYTDASVQTNSLLCPVGSIWKRHFDVTKDYSYYGADLFHPSVKGSEVAAKIIFETLFK